MYPTIIWALNTVVMPLIVSYFVLYIDQHWHGKVEFNRTYARAVSLGVKSRLHPEKVTLDAMYISSQAELEYACSLLNKDFKEVKRAMKMDIKFRLSSEGKFIPLAEGEYCYCVCHQGSSSCPACKHCMEDAAH